MATTLANLRTATRIELRDEDGVTFQDPDIDHAVNMAYRKYFFRIVKAIEDYFVTTTTFSIVANQREYALPADHLRTKLVEYVRDQVTVPLKRYVRGYEANYTGGVSFNPNNEYPEYDFEGDNMVLEPTPLASVTDAIKHTYYPVPESLVNDGDLIHSNFKDAWIDVIVLDATRNCISQIEALGGSMSTDILKRLEEAEDSLDSMLVLRTLSPKRRRRKGYFQ